MRWLLSFLLLLSVNAHAYVINLEWDLVDGAESYRLYEYDNATKDICGIVWEGPEPPAQLTAENSKFFVVRAISHSGIESDNSNILFVERIWPASNVICTRDELIMAATVYYSVSPFGTGDIKTGSPTLTISSGVATLSVAQTGNIGIGCRITYDTTSICYISAVNSATSFNVVTAVGGTPGNEASPVTVNSVAHEYASLSAFFAGFKDSDHINNASLVAADIAAKACLYYDHDDHTLDTTQAVVPVSGTDATRNIEILSPIGGVESINPQFPPNGIYNENYYVLSNTLGCLRVYDPNVSLRNVQVKQTNSGTYYGAIDVFDNDTTGLGFTFNADKIIINMGGGRGYGFYFVSVTDASTAYIRRSIVYNSGAGGSSSHLYTADADWTVTVHSTILASCFSTAILNSAGTINVTNSAIFNNWDDFSGTIACNYCASDDADATTYTNGINWDSEATDWAANFTDYSNGDFTVKDVDASIYHAGTNLDLGADIIGTAWDASTPSIGAFEYVSGSSDIGISPFSTIHNHFVSVPQSFKHSYLNILNAVHNNLADVPENKVDRWLYIKNTVHTDYANILGLLAGRSVYIKNTVHRLTSAQPRPLRNRYTIIKNAVHELLSTKTNLPRNRAALIKSAVHNLFSSPEELKRDRNAFIKSAVHNAFIDIVGLTLPGFVSLVPKSAVHGVYSDILNIYSAFKLNPFSTVHDQNVETEILSLLKGLSIFSAVHTSHSDGSTIKDISDIIISIRDSIHDHLINQVALKRDRIADIKNAVHELYSEKMTLQAAFQLLILDAVHEMAAGKCIFTIGEKHALYNFIAKSNAYDFRALNTPYNFNIADTPYSFKG